MAGKIILVDPYKILSIVEENFWKNLSEIYKTSKEHLPGDIMTKWVKASLDHAFVIALSESKKIKEE